MLIKGSLKPHLNCRDYLIQKSYFTIDVVNKLKVKPYFTTPNGIYHKICHNESYKRGLSYMEPLVASFKKLFGATGSI